MPALDNKVRTDETAARLRARITSGQYAVGSFLPSERRMAAELGVARNTVRSALYVLEEEGRISRKTRRGAMVRDRLGSPVGGVVPLILKQRALTHLQPLTPEAMALVGSALCACGGSDIRFQLQGMPAGGPDGLVEFVRGSRIPGVLFVESDDAELLSRLRAERIPFAVINQELDIPGPATRVDFWAIGRNAADYLLGLGHRRLGALVGPSERHMYDRMLAGFRGRAAESEVYPKPAHVVRVASCSEASRTRTLDILDSRSRPTALFCTRDVRAYGAYLAARELGLSVPGDVSLVGYDDITWPGHGREFLTTFPEPTEQLGTAAIEMLVSWIRTGEMPEDVLISPEIVIRRSTARAGKTARSASFSASSRGKSADPL